MKTNANNGNRPNPYLFENYNIEAFCTPKQSNNRSVLSKILNALVKAINDSPQGHLPKYIMMILDLDIIINAQVYDYRVTKTVEDLCKWLLINTNSAVETRKSDLLSKRQGAISSTSEPRIVWTLMSKRLECIDRKVFALTRKFNNILEGVVANDHRSHVLRVQIEANNMNFDRSGGFTAEGRIEYWKIIDRTMRDFDRGLTDLKPEKKQDSWSATRPNKFKWFNNNQKKGHG